MGLCLLLFIIGFFGLFFLIKKGDLISSAFAGVLALIVVVSLLCFALFGLSSLENYTEYNDKVVRILDKHAAYCEIAKDPVLSAVFVDEIDDFNRNIQEAKRYDSFFMRWVFVSPAYALVDEIERSE